jgi:hypothetical protein
MFSTQLLFNSCATVKNAQTCKDFKYYLKENQQGPFDIKSKFCISDKLVGKSDNCEVKFNVYNRLNGSLVSEGFVTIDSTEYHFYNGELTISISSSNHRIGIASFDTIANKFLIESLDLNNIQYIELNCFVGGVIQI